MAIKRHEKESVLVIFAPLHGQPDLRRLTRFSGIIVGIAPIRSSALNLITYARKQLLLVNEGNEEKLGEFGFSVVIGTALV
jgi:hypothetical protein